MILLLKNILHLSYTRIVPIFYFFIEKREQSIHSRIYFVNQQGIPYSMTDCLHHDIPFLFYFYKKVTKKWKFCKLNSNFAMIVFKT